MISETTIHKLIEEHISGTAVFLVDLVVKPDSKIFVFIDKEGGLQITDCITLSKHIEAGLDREKEDFEIMVSSPGADYPFKVKKQYIKHVGRGIKIKLKNGTELNGTLKQADEQSLLVAAEQPKKSNKKQKEINDVVVSYDDIDEAKGILKFK